MSRKQLFLLLFTILLCSNIFAITYKQDELIKRLEKLEKEFSLKNNQEKIQFFFNGLLEIDVIQQKAVDQSITSQVDLSTLELQSEVKINNKIQGFILVEKQDSPATLFDVKKAYLNFQLIDQNRLVFKVGKMIIPFAKFETNLLSDPLSLTLAETNKNVLLTQFSYNGLITSLYIFKSTTKKQGKDDRLRHSGAELGYMLETKNWTINPTFSYLSNFADTDTLATKVTSTTLKKEVPGYSLNLTAKQSHFSFFLEFVSAQSAFDSSDLAWQANGARPSAKQFEFSYIAPLKYETVFTLGYQSTKESVGLGLTESRTLFSSNSLLNENLSVGIEHFIDKDYSANECSGTICGTGKKGQTTTIRFALTF